MLKKIRKHYQLAPFCPSIQTIAFFLFVIFLGYFLESADTTLVYNTSNLLMTYCTSPFMFYSETLPFSQYIITSLHIRDTAFKYHSGWRNPAWKGMLFLLKNFHVEVWIYKANGTIFINIWYLSRAFKITISLLIFIWRTGSPSWC